MWVPSKLRGPWWRPPEAVVEPKPGEVILVTEKVDVYSLGISLYTILTTHEAWDKIVGKDRKEEVRNLVLRGEPPALDEKYLQSKDPAIVAIRDAMNMCFVPDPEKRASAKKLRKF